MTGKTRAMRPLSGEKGAKRCDSRHFCTVIVSNQLIISRKVREIIMKIGAYCRNRRPICPIRPNAPVGIRDALISVTETSTAKNIARNGATTPFVAARLRGGTMRAGKGREKFFCPGIPVRGMPEKRPSDPGNRGRSYHSPSRRSRSFLG